MVKKWCSVIILVGSLVVVGVGIPAVAQDVCVTDYMANLALPTTVTELRQYIKDLREVLGECDPVSEDIVEVEVLRKPDFELFEQDDNGCYAGVFYGERLNAPAVLGLVGGDSKLSILLELKEPGNKKFVLGQSDHDALDDIILYRWGTGSMPKGRYEVRYEAFIGADPVTLSFEVEHNAEHRFTVYCE